MSSEPADAVASRVATEVVGIVVDWMQLTAPALMMRFGLEPDPIGLIYESPEIPADLDLDATRSQAAHVAARSATLLREAGAGLLEHEGHGCYSEAAFTDLCKLLTNLAEGAATLRELHNIEQVDVEPLMRPLLHAFTLFNGPLEPWLEDYVDKEGRERFYGMEQALRQVTGRSPADEDRVQSTSRACFGPISQETFEDINAAAEGEGHPNLETLDGRITDALSVFPFAAMKVAYEAGIGFPSLAELGFKMIEHPRERSGERIIELVVHDVGGWVFEACGLLHHLEEAELGFRIEDEWTLLSSEQILIFQWHPGMARTLVRRALYDSEDLNFQLGSSEYSRIASYGAAADDPVIRERMVADYLTLSPELGEEMDFELAGRLDELAAALGIGQGSVPLLPEHERLLDETEDGRR